jgi:hypothetical protein
MLEKKPLRGAYNVSHYAGQQIHEKSFLIAALQEIVLLSSFPYLN